MQCLANEFFRNIGAVGVCCIDEVDVQYRQPLQRSQRFGPIARLAPDARACDSHRAKTKAVDLNIAAEFEGTGLGRTDARHGRVSLSNANRSISCAADVGMHFANTTLFHVRDVANPSSGHDRRSDRMKSNATSESRPRAPAFRFQGDGVASINMLSIGALSDFFDTSRPADC